MFLGSPVALEITDLEGNLLEGVIGPFNEYDNITLICKAYGGELWIFLIFIETK